MTTMKQRIMVTEMVVVRETDKTNTIIIVTETIEEGIIRITAKTKINLDIKAEAVDRETVTIMVIIGILISHL